MSFKLIHQHCFISGNLFKETFCSVSGNILQIFFHKNFINHKMSLHVFLDIYKLCFLFFGITYLFLLHRHDYKFSTERRFYGATMIGCNGLKIHRTWIFILIPVMGSFCKNTCVNPKV